MTLTEDSIITEIASTMESGSILSIFYDTYSMGWTLGFKVFYHLLNHHESLGVVYNYSLPVPRLISRAMFASKPDLVEILRQRKLVILDIFGSKYSIPPNEDYIIQIANPTEETLMPKIEKIHREQIYPLARDRSLVRLVYTLDGSVTLFGELPTLKNINTYMASLARETAERRIFTIMLLNKDVVSERLTAWVSSISDTIITFRSSLEEGVLEERMIILRTPSPSFEPTAYDFRLSTKDGKAHHMHFKKIE